MCDLKAKEPHTRCKCEMWDLRPFFIQGARSKHQTGPQGGQRRSRRRKTGQIMKREPVIPATTSSEPEEQTRVQATSRRRKRPGMMPRPSEHRVASTVLSVRARLQAHRTVYNMFVLG